mgnify:CR=1 FL=1
MKTGIELIAEERKRQVEKEGWSSEHDDKHSYSELARAAACYAIPSWFTHSRRMVFSIWPFEPEFFKRTADNRVRDLVKAGALIAAEIDRLNRAEEARVKEVGK